MNSFLPILILIVVALAIGAGLIWLGHLSYVWFGTSGLLAYIAGLLTGLVAQIVRG